MPVHHVSLATGPKHFKEMRDFYLAILAPLGYAVFMDVEGAVGLASGAAGPDFWLHCGGVDFPRCDASTAGADARNRGKTHVAFGVGSPPEVDKWYHNAV